MQIKFDLCAEENVLLPHQFALLENGLLLLKLIYITSIFTVYLVMNITYCIQVENWDTAKFLLEIN